jgi:hypothetical protein
MRRLASALACLLPIASLSSPAWADDAQEAERTTLFREGSAMAERGDWEGAAAKFRRVVELRSAPRALIALAVAEDHLRHLTSAKHLYEKAIADARAASLADDEKKASDALGALAPRIPHLLLKVPADQAAVNVTIDGEQMAVHDAEYDLDPGPHTIVVEGVEWRQFRRVVTLGEKDRVEVVAVFAREPTAAPPPPVETSRPGNAPGGGPPLGAILLASAGVVAAGTGIVLWIVGKGQENDVIAKCGGTTTCPGDQKSALQPDIDASKTKIVVGDVAFGVGAAAIAGGAVWWLLGGSSHEATTARLDVAPRLGGAWITYTGSF